jgi:hypothetical protein
MQWARAVHQTMVLPLTETEVGIQIRRVFWTWSDFAAAALSPNQLHNKRERQICDFLLPLPGSAAHEIKAVFEPTRVAAKESLVYIVMEFSWAEKGLEK